MAPIILTLRGEDLLKVKRVYDPIEKDDGNRFLVDRLWPRGVSKDSLHIEGWLKEAAPSNALRKWFGHEPEKWGEFCRRYFTELDNIQDAIQPLLESSSHNNITLLYSAKDTRYNNAIALKEYIEKKVI